jgi:hypothetical protein
MKPNFKKACENQGYNPDTIMPDLSNYPEKHRGAVSALMQLLILADDANPKDWTPDFNNGDQYKWTPWVDMETDENNPSGFRFFGAYCVSTDAGADLGSRLSFVDEKTTKKFFEENIELYKDLMTLPKKAE